jgi:hypothetical protein
MNLSEMRQVLVEQTGYTGLVTDAIAADYSDKSGLLSNATYFINAGVRWLVRRWPGKGSELRFAGNLLTGSHTFNLPYIQFIRRLDLSDGTTVTHPRMISYDEMRAKYGEPFADVDSGKPIYWSWNPRPARSLAAPIVNGAFGDGLASWETAPNSGGSSSVTAGVLSLVDSGNPSPAILQRLSSVYPQETEVTIDIATLPDGVLRVFFGMWNDSTQDYELVHLESITTAGVHTFDGDTDGNWDTIAIGYVSTGTSTATVNSIEIVAATSTPEIASYASQLIFMPPASVDYTVEIWGDFAASPLVNNNDYNWWTSEHPDLVVNAARSVYERQGHRNVSGAKAFEESCDEELARLYSEYRFSLYSGMAPEDMALNG